MRGAALVAAVLLAVVGVFQLALAAGALLGRASWGGRHDGALPRRLRIASGVAGLVVYPLIAVVVLLASGAVGAGWSGRAAALALWLLAGLFALGTLANLASRSSVERIWAPVSAVIGVCCAVIAAAV